MNRILALFLAVIPCILLASEESPYAGQELRQVKSLSEREIASLLRGDGMGFAKLAELNHFPGPKHVLEIADQLSLSPEQLSETRSLYEEMRRNAVALGRELLLAESRLDQAFQDKSISSESLESALLEISEIRARLRYVHLEAHLRQKKLLRPEQIQRYDEVRGYHGGARAHDH
jgi:hypothetical protein